MCEYCGCQDVPAIAELTTEHDRLRELGRDLQKAAAADNFPTARAAADAMRAVLGPHTEVEELGLFPRLSDEFPDRMSALVDEHHSIDAVLVALSDTVTPPDGWRQQAHQVVAALFEHILQEQDGVFPAALATLDAAGWERLSAIRGQLAGPITTRR